MYHIEFPKKKVMLTNFYDNLRESANKTSDKIVFNKMYYHYFIMIIKKHRNTPKYRN